MPKIFITGGARRLGKNLVLLFAKHGWDVSFLYYHSKDKAKSTLKELSKYNVSSFAFKADIRNYKELETGFGELVENFGVPNVIINNSAIFPKKKNIKELEIKEWQNVLDTNLNSVFFTSKIFAGYAKTGSNIINIASIGAFEIWNARIAYHVSKAGVIQLTKALARELAPDISVNSVSPGTIEIPGEPDSEIVPKIIGEKTPMKRNATINDVFDACYFFATNTNFITGTNIIVDGGYSLTR